MRDSLQSFVRKRSYPITLLRIISELTNENEFFKIFESGYITDFSGFNKIKLITNINHLPDFLFYLFGVLLGDGTINKERIKIVDGDGREDKIKFSRDFLEKIKKKMEEIFKTRVPPIRKIKHKNCYELVFNNKWLCYYLNFLFGLEFGRKIDPKIQRRIIFNNHQMSLIIRGLFDTDGSLDGYRATFASKYSPLFKEVLQFLKDKNINNIAIREISKNRTNLVFTLEILSQDVSKYAKLIGFSHPRKSLEIKQYILSNSQERIIKAVKEKEIYEIGHFLRPIAKQKLRVISDFFRLNKEKREELIKMFNNRFKCNFRQMIRKNNHLNNKKITRLFMNIFEYEPKRKSVSDQAADDLYNSWSKIWD